MPVAQNCPECGRLAYMTGGVCEFCEYSPTVVGRIVGRETVRETRPQSKEQYVFRFYAAALGGKPPQKAVIIIQEINPREVELARETNRVNAIELALYLHDYTTGETAGRIADDIQQRLGRIY